MIEIIVMGMFYLAVVLMLAVAICKIADGELPWRGFKREDIDSDVEAALKQANKEVRKSRAWKW